MKDCGTDAQMALLMAVQSVEYSVALKVPQSVDPKGSSWAEMTAYQVVD